MINVDSIVTPNYTFERERSQFGYNYPVPGDLLTVIKVAKDELGNRLLWFQELKIPIPLAEVCFDELQDGADGDALLNDVFKIANNL